MFFHQRFIPGLAIASYIVGDEKSKRCAVIDPTRDVDEYLRVASAEGMTISDILETHVHADFVSGARELKARLNDAPLIHCSGMGGQEWTPLYADRIVKEGDEVQLGGVRLRAMHTPGHTPEHVSWALFDDSRSTDTAWLIFTGDFVFVGDVGRPDLLGDVERATLAHQLYESVFQRLAPLPDFVEIFPSHGAGSLCGKAIGSRRSSSLGFERRFNPSMRSQPEPLWAKTLLHGMPLAPHYFKRMKRINVQGPPILGEKLRATISIGARALHDELIKSHVVLDARPKEMFAAANLPGSINIPLSPQLSTWAGWVLPDDQPIVLIAANPDEVREIVTQLIRVGFDDIAGHLDGGFQSWTQAGYPVARLGEMSVTTLANRMRAADAPVLVDVRTEGEWQAGHINGARHIHGGTIAQRVDELPRDREVAVMCASGYRSAIAASILKREGFENVASVTGGMSAWTAAGLPNET